MGVCQGITIQLLGNFGCLPGCCYVVAIRCSRWLSDECDAVATVFQVNGRVNICGCYGVAGGRQYISTVCDC